MPSYLFNYSKPPHVVLGRIKDELDILAAGSGVVIERLEYHDGTEQIEVFTDIALTGPQQTALGNAISNHNTADYNTLSEAAKVTAKDVINDLENLHTEALTYYSNLTGPEKAAFFNTLTNWNSANAAARTDALRGLLSLVIVALYFIYLKFINNGQ